MKRLSVTLAIAATLSACGSGSGSSSSGSGNTGAVDNGPVVDIVPTVGDFYSYRSNATFTLDQAGATPQSLEGITTDVVSKVDSDGSWVDTNVSDDAATPAAEYRHLADGGLSTIVAGSCTATYTPALYASQKNLAVGTTWTSNYNRVDSAPCAAQSSGKASATAVALETVTVAAGTFNTVKIVSTRTASFSNGYSTADDITEWRDAVTHRLIKFTNRSNQVSDTGQKATMTSSAELLGYASAKQKRQSLNIERFAGAWAGSYAGTSSGNCLGQVSRAGKLDADCGNGLFTVHGDIDASGKGTFYLSVNGVKGASFSGAFDSPLGIAGVWSAGAASGTWLLGRQ